MHCKFKVVFTPLIFLFIGGFLLQIACTQPRREKFAQGMGDNNLQKIATYDGMSFPLCTGEPLAGPALSTAREFVVGDDVQDMNVLPLVTYSSPQAELLPPSLAFFGRPNDCASYRIMYKVDDQYLRVMKVAKWQDIPYQERTYAEALDDNRAAVPILGYPVEHIRVEKRRNADDEETNEFIEVRVQHQDQATDFRFNRTKFHEFAAENKVNLFPTQYFGFDDPAHEWYYAAGIVEAEAHHEGHESLFLPFDTNFDLATQVRFCRIGENRVVVVNATLDPARKTLPTSEVRMGVGPDLPSCVHNPAILNFEGRPLDFSIEKSGERKGMAERVSHQKAWPTKPWISLNLKQVQSPFGVGEVERVEIQPDSLVLTLLYHGETRARIRHTFLRKKSAHQNRLVGAFFYKEDKKNFYPVAYTVPHETKRQDNSPRAQDRREIIPKFDTERRGGVIRYRLVEPSIVSFNRHAEKAFAAVNWALRQADVDFRVELEKDPEGRYLTTAIGDARHNFVYYAKTLGGSGNLGTAQVIPDGITGEVLYAGYRIDVTGIENEIQRDVINFILSEVGVVPSQLLRERLRIADAPRVYEAHAPANRDLPSSGENLWREMQKQIPSLLSFPFFYGAMDSPNTPIQFTHVSAEPTRPLEHEQHWFARIAEQQSEQLKKRQTADRSSGNPLFFACAHGQKSFSGRIFSGLAHPTQPGCLNLREHITTLQGKTSREVAQSLDLEIVDLCVRELSDDVIVSVSIHELLHTLSLGHNFKGSYDRPNFYRAKDVQDLLADPELGPLVQRAEQMSDEQEYADSASIMDYQLFSDHMLNLPGRSDIQMLRYVYGSHLLTADGTLAQKPVDKEIDKTTLSVSEAVAGQGKALLPWQTCQDEREPAFDPFCRPYDRGSTPREVALSYIEKYRLSLAKGGFQYAQGQQVSPQVIPLMRLMGALYPLRQIYDHWRLELRHLTGESNRYLQDFQNQPQYYEFLKQEGLNPHSYKTRTSANQKGTLAGEFHPLQPWLDAAQTIKDFFLEEILFMHNRYCAARPQGKKGLDDVVLVELDRLRTELSGSRSLAIESCHDLAVQEWLAQRNLRLVDEQEEMESEFGTELLTGMYKAQSKDLIYDSYDYVGTIMDRLNTMLLAVLPMPTGPQFRQLGFVPTMMNEPDFVERFLLSYIRRLRVGVEVPLKKASAKPLFSANFAAERGLLSQYAHLMVLGSQVPGHPYESMKRTKQFQVFATPSWGNGGSHLAQVALGGVSFSVPSPESTLALPLVEDINRLSFTELTLANVGQNPYVPPLNQLALNGEELDFLRKQLIDSMPAPLAPFPTNFTLGPPPLMPFSFADSDLSAMALAGHLGPRPTTYKQYIPWLRHFNKLVADPTLSPKMRIALNSLFTTDVQLLSASTESFGVELVKIIKALREVMPQAASHSPVTTQIAEPDGEQSNEEATGAEQIDSLIADWEKKGALDRPLEPSLQMRFARNSLEYRLTEYQTQQDSLTRQLTLFADPKSGLQEIAAQRELLFSVLLSFSRGGLAHTDLLVPPPSATH